MFSPPQAPVKRCLLEECSVSCHHHLLMNPWRLPRFTVLQGSYPLTDHLIHLIWRKLFSTEDWIGPSLCEDSLPQSSQNLHILSPISPHFSPKLQGKSSRNGCLELLRGTTVFFKKPRQERIFGKIATLFTIPHYFFMNYAAYCSAKEAGSFSS